MASLKQPLIAQFFSGNMPSLNSLNHPSPQIPSKRKRSHRSVGSDQLGIDRSHGSKAPAAKRLKGSLKCNDVAKRSHTPDENEDPLKDTRHPCSGHGILPKNALAKPSRTFKSDTVLHAPKAVSRKQVRLDTTYGIRELRHLDCVLIDSTLSSKAKQELIDLLEVSSPNSDSKAQVGSRTSVQASDDLRSVRIEDDSNEYDLSCRSQRPRRARAKRVPGETPSTSDSDDKSNETDSEDVSNEADSDFANESREGSVISSTKSDFVETETEGSSIEDDEDFEAGGDNKSRISKPNGRVSQRTEKSTIPGMATTKKKVLNKIKPHSNRSGLAVHLPPICDIKEIFHDITKKALRLGLRTVLQDLDTEPIRVATMCSGTESPLLALKMVSKCLEDQKEGILNIDHLFSAEIVPYKQAYIERNFQPPVIFQDITDFINCEPDKLEARTAFGGNATVPQRTHILVAGTSCVDYSILNNRQKKLEETGESGDTWRGMLAYVRIARPCIVILENVMGSGGEPWNTMLRHFRDIEYDCEVVACDSKNYYIPQTRNRKYMLALDAKRFKNTSKAAVGRWAKLMKHFERPASSSVTDFLLHPQDPLLEKARADLTNQDSRTREVPWEACKIRHADYRGDCKIGEGKPFTHWVTGGTCEVPEGCNRDWFKAKVPRVWDFLDISLLRAAMPERGYDLRHKSRILDVSQNINHGGEDTTPFGLTGCLTPSGDFYSTTRGGPITGVECLALQGLPIQDLNLTIETNQQLQDLAGNAMTSTIVGSAILAALIVIEKLPKWSEQAEESAAAPVSFTMADDHLTDASCKVIGDAEPFALQDLLQDVSRSIARCSCETQTTNSRYEILRCSRCGHKTCKKCHNARVHHYVQDVLAADRHSPVVFEGKWRKKLPTSIRFFENPDLSPFPAAIKILEKWAAGVDSAAKPFEENFIYQRMQRSASRWTVLYESPNARLLLVLSNTKAEWQMFLKPSKTLPADSALRDDLLQPLGRCDFHPPSLSSQPARWRWLSTQRKQEEVNIQPMGHITKSWRARMGIPRFKSESIPTALRISPLSTTKDTTNTDTDIYGLYNLESRCQTAMESLYIRQGESGDDPMNLFLQQELLKMANFDSFVFAKHAHFRHPGMTHELTAKVSPSWKPWLTSSSKVSITRASSWKAQAGELNLEPLPQTIELAAFDFQSAESVHPDCSRPTTILNCSLPTESMLSTTQDRHFTVDSGNNNTWETYSNVIGRLRAHNDLNVWHAIDTADANLACSKCAPRPALLRWRLIESGKTPFYKPYEDMRHAGAAERSYKSRPDIFITQVHVHGTAKDMTKVRIGANIGSLIHRAAATLRSGEANNTLEAFWKLDMNFVDAPVPYFSNFTLLSNSRDSEYLGDVGFKDQFLLRPDQRRSLSWMKMMEHDARNIFHLEAYAEGLLPGLHWRAEGMVKKPVQIRGGLLADDVGYGKTITSLALISSDVKTGDQENSFSNSVTSDQLLRSRATLIVCPEHLVAQWHTELRKFVCDSHIKLQDILVIKGLTSLWNTSKDKICNAKVIILSSDVLEDEKHMENTAAFAGMAVPEKSCRGRRFQCWLDQATQRTVEHVAYLGKIKGDELCDKIQARYEETVADDAFAFQPSERLKGSTYVKKKQEGAKKQKGLKGKQAILPKWNKKPTVFMFEFRRLIIDESADVRPDSQLFVMLVQLRAQRRWILSATQPMTDFADVTNIARLLGVNLGINATPPNAPPRRRKELLSEMTDAETFHTYREARTSSWYETVHEYCQRFLHHVARQNPTDMSAFAVQDKVEASMLTAEHHSEYVELLKHFQAKDMEFQGPDHDRSDREKRITRAMRGSEDPEQALLRSALLHLPSSANDINFGRKFEVLCRLVSDTPPDEKVLVFAPGAEMVRTCEQVLTAANIKNSSLWEGSKTRSESSLKDFKKHGKVLILDLAGKPASGLNLEYANHVVFLSPLLADNQQEYSAKMRQAMGRAVRYGQTRTIHIYRLVALKTVDVDILEQRERRTAGNAIPGLEASDAELEHVRLVKKKDGAFELALVSQLENIQARKQWVGVDKSFTSLERFSTRYAER